MTRIADLRKSYELGELDEHHALTGPFEQFRQWFKEALEAEIPEPNAMSVGLGTPRNTEPVDSEPRTAPTAMEA